MSYAHIPETISDEAKALLQLFGNPALREPFPAPDDQQAWDDRYEEIEKEHEEVNQAAEQQYRPVVESKRLGGVPVLDIQPKGWRNNGKILVYTHGGGYTVHSAKSTLLVTAPLAHDTGLRIISVDYTLAPRGKWQQVTHEVIRVMQALMAEGYALNQMAIFGEGSGGSLAAGAVLKMRDLQLGMPAAVVLWSPWADMTETGDTYVTLKDADAILHYDRQVKPSAAAYADPSDLKHPYISPVYGDYAKGYPPTLIQGATKEICLSSFIRLYQALDTAGQIVKLDLYEGLTHVFQAEHNLPESILARRKVRDFLNQYLGQ
ncbi:alpha/beta hydrolase fold domain-containing protein [Candidatus Entotheonella palauensis]|uniref:alpha/beta hydrolase fold domain-containing protein n=1 Tax=Candidatus Entotheonella palauensis TaxID=93172 RepID=UPI000B7EA56A|nr:alpha/beta hydrolase fold domain-containing protein [Candidatus Entotheonella palauensis]